MLKGVVVKRHDTCLTYVLKRVGVWDKFPLYESSNIQSIFKIISVGENTELRKGMIVGWYNNIKAENVYCEITIRGLLEQRLIDYKHHFGVVESDCTISDLTRKDNYRYPRLRIREIIDDTQHSCEHFVRRPDFYLELLSTVI